MTPDRTIYRTTAGILLGTQFEPPMAEVIAHREQDDSFDEMTR